MNTPRHRTAAALLALAASACGAARDAHRAPEDAAGQRWSLVEELRIGSADDPETSLTRVSGLAIGPQGHIYVAQRQDEQIRAYDRDGRFVRAFGGKGNGPGEFTHLFAIGLLADTVYAVNAQPARLSFFTLEGEHIETTLLAAPPADDYGALVPFKLFPDGTGVATRFFTPEAVASGRVRMVPTLRIGRTGRILGTLFQIPAERTGVRIPLGSSVLSLHQPFPDHPLAVSTADGRRMAIVERGSAPAGAADADFRITMTTLSHDTLYSRSYRYSPVPIPAEVVDRVVSRLVAGPGRMLGGPLEAERTIRAALDAPASYPPVTAALFADDGNLWLRREDRDGAEEQLWEVHGPDGDPVAVVRMPARIAVHLIHQDVVWGVEHDELDVPYVVAYRIERGGR